MTPNEDTPLMPAYANTFTMRIVCVSDTHTERERLIVPGGDVLVHAGDLTYRGRIHELEGELAWLGSLPHKYKVLIAGNHDFGFENSDADYLRTVALHHGLIYLQDDYCTIGGRKFYGSPWQPWFHDWAFNLPRDGKELEKTWAMIPDDTDVLITHGPPYGILDETGLEYRSAGPGEHVGCKKLRKRVETIKSLRLHIFGHIHESHGRRYIKRKDRSYVTFVNAAICNRQYQPENSPIVVDL